MADKNQINIRIGLEGDDDIKRKLDGVRDAGKKAGEDLSKSLNGSGQAFGGFGKTEESRLAAERLRQVLHTLHPVLDQAGLGIGNLGAFARVAGAGFGAFAAAAVGAAIVGLAKLSDQAATTKKKLSDLGAGKGAFSGLEEDAKKLGAAPEKLVAGFQELLRLRNELNNNGVVTHPTKFEGPDGKLTAEPPSGTPEPAFGQLSDDKLRAANRSMIQLLEAGKAEDPAKDAQDFFKSLRTNKRLTPDALKNLSDQSYGGAEKFAQALPQNFSNLQDAQRFLDKGGKVSNQDVLRGLERVEPEAAKAAKAVRGLGQAFDGLGSSFNGLTKSLAGEDLGKLLTGEIDKVSHTIDETGKEIDAIKKTAADLFKSVDVKKGFVEGVKGGGDAIPQYDQQGNPLGTSTAAAPSTLTVPPVGDFLQKALTDPGALQERQRPDVSGALSKAGADQSKAAEDQSRAAEDLSRAAQALLAAGHKAAGTSEDQSKANSSPLMPSSVKKGAPSTNSDGTRNPYAGVDNGGRTDGYTHPFAQAPRNEAERQQQLRETAAISEYETEQAKKFAAGIRAQTGFNNPSPDAENFKPAELGHYDQNQNFVANPKQPVRDPSASIAAPQSQSYPAYQNELTKQFERNGTATVPGNPEDIKIRPIQDQRSDAGDLAAPQQFAGLSETIQQAFQSILGSITKQPDLKQEGPASGLGIRGEADNQAARSVEDLGQAADSAKGDFAALAEALTPAVAKIRSAEVAAKDGGLIRHFDGGGHIRGAGTSTSDSIPAMLSDGEYVMKAAAVDRIGVDKLDAANNGMAHFAEGGATKDAPDFKGSLSVTYDPTTGGAFINGNLFPPGSPILEDPRVKQLLAESKASMNQKGDGSNKRKSKSDFTGIFGGHVFDQEGSYAAGGLVGHAKGFADGGPVGNRAASRLSSIIRSFGNGGIVDYDVSHLAAGGMPEMPSPTLSPSELNDTGASGIGMLHPVTLNLPGGGSVEGVYAQPDAVKQLQRAAVESATVSAGPKPSWYGSRGG